MRLQWQRLASFALALGILMTVPGCNYLRQIFSGIQLPKVTVAKVDPKLLNIATALLKFDLRITNPNPIGLKLAGIRYTLDAGGREVATGTTRKGVKLKPKGRSGTKVDVKIKLLDVASSLVDLLGKGKLGYKGRFALAFDTPVGQIEVPISHSGKFPLPKKPPISIKSVQVASAGPSGVGLVFNVLVQNPNPFKMPLDVFSMGAKVNNRQLATVRAPGGLSMNPGQPLTIPLRVNASLSALGLTAIDLARHPSLTYSADMNLKSGPLQLPQKTNGRFGL
jgi:LEA14-like dessication related protein